MKNNLNLISDDQLDELAKRFFTIFNSQQICKPIDTDNSTEPKEEILFQSLKQASEFYGICYQTLSKHLDKLKHNRIGRRISIYKSDIDSYFGRIAKSSSR